MSDQRIRRMRESDVPAVVELVHELAEYVESGDECHLTEDQLIAEAFGSSPTLFVHVAEVDGAVVGCATWFLTYSTWRGTKGIYLMDLYVRPGHRGAGLGTALLVALASECVARGYSRLEWSVLDWNASAVKFYEVLGAEPMRGRTEYRLSDSALVVAANSTTSTKMNLRGRYAR